MNLKLTAIQMDSYVKIQRLPTLQELANTLEKDIEENGEIEYVHIQSKNNELSSLSADINIGNSSSIYTKLKEFPYEFEINDSLQLASIDGVSLTVDADSEDENVTLSKKQYSSILDRLSALENNNSNNSTSEIYSKEETVIGTWINGKKLYRKAVDIPEEKESESGVKFYTIDIPNVEYVTVDVSHSFIYVNTPEYIPIVNIWDSGNTGGYTILPHADNFTFQWYRTYWKKFPATIVFEYTKTTD